MYIPTCIWFVLVDIFRKTLAKSIAHNLHTISNNFFRTNCEVKISDKFRTSFEQISNKFQTNFEKISKKFRKNFEKISNKFRKNFEKISKKFRKKFEKISKKFRKNFEQISKSIFRKKVSPGEKRHFCF
jgi:cyclopropane fatty-acyl-phospholipid synthase-like methyltransferase